MVKQIKSSLSQGQQPELAITKKCQVYGKHAFDYDYTDEPDYGNSLTSRHASSPYPTIQDTKYHMNPRDVIKVLRHYKEGEAGKVESFWCKNERGQHFHLLIKDFKRFAKTINQ